MSHLKSLLSVATCFLFFGALGSHVSADLVYVFEDTTGVTLPSDPLDGGGDGAMMTVIDSVDPTCSVILETEDILVPEYEFDAVNSVWVATGNVLSATSGDNVQTNINGNADAIGINNPSISNTNYDTLGDGDGAEGNDFNVGESWVFSFDQDVTFDSIEFESMDPGDTLTVFVNGVQVDQFVDVDGDQATTGFTVLTGDLVTFEASGDFLTDYRIESLTVSKAVPEPNSLLFLAGLGLVALKRRR